MIRKMMWQPDTCGCQLHLEYDSLDEQRKVIVSHPGVQDKAAASTFLRSKDVDAVVE
jgi:hypothetical protein